MSNQSGFVGQIKETPWIFYILAILPFVGFAAMIISIILKAVNYSWAPLAKASMLVLILLIFWIPAIIMIIVKLLTASK